MRTILSAILSLLYATSVFAEEPKCAGAKLDMSQETRLASAFVGMKECWDTDVTDDKLVYLNDFYARWIVEMVPAAEGVPRIRDYEREKFNIFQRIFIGGTRSALVSVKIQMHDPDIDFTVPLVSIAYNGKAKQAESFVTLIDRADMSHADFRISANSSVTIEANATVSKQVDAAATGVVVGALQDVLSVVAPQGSLITAVNKDQVQKVSSSFDSALSKLLSSSMSETFRAGRLLSEWSTDASILIAVDVPNRIATRQRMADGSTVIDDPTQLRRLWFRIRMTCPRLSIFDPANACEDRPGQLDLITAPNFRDRGSKFIAEPQGPGRAAFRRRDFYIGQRVSAQQVLNFKLGAGKTLRELITSQDWYLNLTKLILDTSVGNQTSTNTKAADPPKLPDGTATEAAPGDAAAADAALQVKATEILPNPKNRAAADQFCEAVVDKLYGTGLSHYDAEMGMWAIATGIPDFVASAQIFAQAGTCSSHLPYGKRFTTTKIVGTGKTPK